MVTLAKKRSPGATTGPVPDRPSDKDLASYAAAVGKQRASVEARLAQAAALERQHAEAQARLVEIRDILAAGSAGPRDLPKLRNEKAELQELIEIVPIRLQQIAAALGPLTDEFCGYAIRLAALRRMTSESELDEIERESREFLEAQAARQNALFDQQHDASELTGGAHRLQLAVKAANSEHMIAVVQTGLAGVPKE